MQLGRVLGSTAKISCDQHHLKHFSRNIFDVMEGSVMKLYNLLEQTGIVNSACDQVCTNAGC